MIYKKDLHYGVEAQQKLVAGINKLARAVGSSLGPKGRLTSYNGSPGYDVAPLVLRDGVSIARNVNLADPVEDMGARLVKQAAIKQVEQCGDGTTLVTILTQAIVNEAVKQIAAGANPMTLKKQIEEDRDKILLELKKLAKEIPKDSFDEIKQIATISASDPSLGELIAEAMQKVGANGVIRSEVSKSLETTIKYHQGMEIDRGYLSPYFVTDQKKVEAVVEDPYILITDKRLNYADDMIPFFERLLPISKNIIIIAGEVVEEALQFLVANRLHPDVNLKVIAIQAPAYGGRRTDELEDLAILTGGTAILEESGRLIKDVQIADLGRADKVTSDRDKTVILGGKGNAEALEKYTHDLSDQISVANSDHDRDIKEERLAKLSGGVAVINVGAATEMEAVEKRERVIDALAATKAAVAEGIVAGGEVTMLELADGCSDQILKEALKAPFKKLITNAGYDYADVRESMAGLGYPWGFDVMGGEIGNLIESGIVDPAKVIRCAIENAVSVAGMILTIDTTMTEVEPKDG